MDPTSFLQTLGQIRNMVTNLNTDIRFEIYIHLINMALDVFIPLKSTILESSPLINSQNQPVNRYGNLIPLMHACRTTRREILDFFYNGCLSPINQLDYVKDYGLQKWHRPPQLFLGPHIRALTTYHLDLRCISKHGFQCDAPLNNEEDCGLGEAVQEFNMFVYRPVPSDPTLFKFDPLSEKERQMSFEANEKDKGKEFEDEEMETTFLARGPGRPEFYGQMIQQLTIHSKLRSLFRYEIYDNLITRRSVGNSSTFIGCDGSNLYWLFGQNPLSSLSTIEFVMYLPSSFPQGYSQPSTDRTKKPTVDLSSSNKNLTRREMKELRQQLFYIWNDFWEWTEFCHPNKCCSCCSLPSLKWRFVIDSSPGVPCSTLLQGNLPFWNADTAGYSFRTLFTIPASDSEQSEEGRLLRHLSKELSHGKSSHLDRSAIKEELQLIRERDLGWYGSSADEDADVPFVPWPELRDMLDSDYYSDYSE